MIKFIYPSKIHSNKSIKRKAYFDNSQTIDDVYENLNDYNPTRKRRVLIVLDDMKADMELNPIVTELLLRGRKLNISLAFILQSYFRIPKTIRLNATHYFIRRIPNKI